MTTRNSCKPIQYHPSAMLHSQNYSWQKLAKSGCDTCLDCESSSPDWRHKDSQLKWVPCKLLSEFFVACNCVSVSECNVTLGLYRTIIVALFGLDISLH